MENTQFNEEFNKAYKKMIETPDLAIKEACEAIAKDCLDHFKGSPVGLKTLHAMQDYIKDKYKLIMVWRKMKYVGNEKPITYDVLEFYELGYLLHFEAKSLMLARMDEYEY